MPTSPRRPLIAAVAGLSTVALLLTACATVPYTNRKQLVLLDFPSEVQLGADAYTQILADETVVPKGANAQAVRTVGKRLSRRTPSRYRSLDWEFKLLKSDTMNAFALPGGKVAVYNGIIPIMASEAGMAAVVGHEIGHAVARHGAERITGSMFLQLGLSAADISLGNSQYREGIMQALGLGATIGIVLPFSRANELEADYLGGVFMAKAGYDPRHSVKVWENMTKLNGDNPLPLLSTHPSNAKRIQRLSDEMANFQKFYKKAKKKYGKGADLNG